MASFRISDVKTDLKDMKASVTITENGEGSRGPRILIGNIDISSIGDLKASEVDAAVKVLVRTLLSDAASAY